MHTWCLGGTDFVVCVDVLNSVLQTLKIIFRTFMVCYSCGIGSLFGPR